MNAKQAKRMRRKAKQLQPQHQNVSEEFIYKTLKQGFNKKVLSVVNIAT